MINEKNVYPIDHWREDFFKIPEYAQLAKDARHVVFSQLEATLIHTALDTTIYKPIASSLKKYNILDACSLYYIKYLLEINPTTIADIGSGVNRFKNLFPDIVGVEKQIDMDHDIGLLATVDDEWVEQHQNQYDAIICINMLHFTHIEQVCCRLQWIYDMLAPGGRAFVAFNLETWLMKTSPAQLKRLFNGIPILDQAVDIIHKQVESLGLNLIVNDWAILRQSHEGTVRDSLNGNIRLVFEK